MANFMENVKEKVSGIKSKALLAVPVAVTAFPAVAFASETGGSDMTTSMQTAFTAVKTDFSSAVTVIAPIALGIAGIFIAWKLGFRFFKSLTKG